MFFDYGSVPHPTKRDRRAHWRIAMAATFSPEPEHLQPGGASQLSGKLTKLILRERGHFEKHTLLAHSIRML